MSGETMPVCCGLDPAPSRYPPDLHAVADGMPILPGQILPAMIGKG